MKIRIISGVIGLCILAALLLLPAYITAITILAASIIGLYEFSKALKEKDVHIDLPVSVIATFIIVAKAYSAGLSESAFPALTGFMDVSLSGNYLNAFLYIIIVYLFCRIIFGKGSFGIEDMAYTFLGIIYIPFLLSFAVATRNLERGFQYIWLVVIGAVATDTFAYFTGVTIGKTKIIPHISPKKTVEGSIGGIIGCMLAMVLYGILVMNGQDYEPVEIYHLAVLGLLCGFVSQLGDWAASSIKRNMGIKDFGNLIPGHGGIMDRIDSVLFVAPIVYIYINIFLL
ncbi:MAG: phosphatidate cytidylyltransferase [Clostridiaceae bacterium]|nr:phosphatidate cytidylyltransferase [Clostridiaceae bacterium]